MLTLPTHVRHTILLTRLRSAFTSSVARIHDDTERSQFVPFPPSPPPAPSASSVLFVVKVYHPHRDAGNGLPVEMDERQLRTLSTALGETDWSRMHLE